MFTHDECILCTRSTSRGRFKLPSQLTGYKITVFCGRRNGGCSPWTEDFWSEEIVLTGGTKETRVQPNGGWRGATEGGEKAIQTHDSNCVGENTILGDVAVLQRRQETPFEVVKCGNAEARNDVASQDNGNDKRLAVASHTGARFGTREEEAMKVSGLSKTT